MSDRDAEFRDFVTARLDPLRALAYLTCGDWQVAEDAAVTALSKLYLRWGKVDHPEAYARTIAVRAAIDETRRPWWRREQSHGDALPELPVDGEQHEIDERLRIRQALSRLPVKLRAVLVLRYLEELSVQETAAALRCPEGTVKAYTSRGLEALREILDERKEGRRAFRHG
ncbi:DNA-directed RNA polymerase sigma-70 factor [Paractinoplanes abujensis]|uniref:RNA polymerase sigma-70 factor (Sigma-E family) n=1 Tax=Paractinoplanes abujensis TaxID=882441 RepID=A0A7W7CYX5_9ACTN|nr:SigE family RNA polymerase sigma factor [Actinoplanes abujensis]MBB4695868.1 RNA polymerase sigma-70 factor (sigma-E family) [Actinoplanes abujensis]GID23458.1 DNA-directed RNA polymerase sigma-70 factor [Actinoplanes abujensis]